MAGETICEKAVCLAIRPWSRTSHIVSWLTANGRVSTLVKGAVRPKSAFLGQYDLNYTCEILYYARARGELHALRECSAIQRRDALRSSYRSLMLAEYFRKTAAELAPTGPEAAEWLDALESALGSLEARADSSAQDSLRRLLDFEMCAKLQDLLTQPAVFPLERVAFTRKLRERSGIAVLCGGGALQPVDIVHHVPAVESAERGSAESNVACFFHTQLHHTE